MVPATAGWQLRLRILESNFRPNPAHGERDSCLVCDTGKQLAFDCVL